MPNIITTPIRADREYTGLLEAVEKGFRGKSLPILASGLCTGAADALTVCLCEDSAASRKTPVLIICPEEKECQRLRRDLEQFGALFPKLLSLKSVKKSGIYDTNDRKNICGSINGTALAMPEIISSKFHLLDSVIPILFFTKPLLEKHCTII